MNFESLALPAVVLISITATVLLMSNEWRLSIAALAAQYCGAFVLVVISWPVEMAVVKLVAGWMSGAVLGMALIGLQEDISDQAQGRLNSLLFRLLAALMVWPVILTIAPRTGIWVSGATSEQIHGGMILVGLGLLHLGIRVRPMGVALGLLTVLAGFEILYATVESSALVAGLLAFVNLGLALVGAYLTTVPPAEEPA